ncbi:MAG TPA: hypothetical protein DG753_12880 [Clostridium sp.]|nr:hypothetical protein [Clostridium sp.]
MISLILHIITIVICIVLISLIGLLVIPFDYNFHGYINEKIYGIADVRWLLGLTKFIIYKEKEKSRIKIRFNICGLKVPIAKSKKNHIKDKKKKVKKNSNRKIRITKKLINICYEYLKDIINIVKPKYINISGTYGFDNPFITGIVCGVISMINSLIPNSVVNVKPEFEDEIYDMEIKGNGRIVGFIVLIRTLRFIINKEIRKNIFSKKQKDVKPLKA